MARQGTGDLDVRMSADPAAACADSIGRRLRAAVRLRGRAKLAVSGGSTTPPMFAALATLDVPWQRVDVGQVDERVAPDGHRDRNATQLDAVPGHHHLMPVTDPDLAAATGRYARSLPDRFDVVHLGMGADGHTASWPPGDPVISSRAPVAVSQPYQGRVRMTLTPAVVNRARGRVVLLRGADKATALATWVAGGVVPISAVRRSRTVVFCDVAATGLTSAAPAAAGSSGRTRRRSGGSAASRQAPGTARRRASGR
jgi:6-phosphogluconolactonase/glucosamine-6-phosphate isomerase/deaminase